jgi:hypothetical protein
MRLNEFGGDTVFVTKHDCYWMSAIERMFHEALESKEDQRLEHTGFTINIEVSRTLLKTNERLPNGANS